MSASPLVGVRRGLLNWSTRDLLTAFAIALVFAVLLVPVTYLYAAALSLGVIARSLMSGLYFLPAAFGGYVMRKPGAILLVSMASGLAAMFFSPYGFVVLLVSLLTGSLGELAVWLVTRYGNYTPVRWVIAGALAGLAEYLLILFSLRASQLEWWVGALAALISALTFALSAVVARLLAHTVVKTGVLANTKLGQSVTDDI
ncbi:MAG TPA: ECF transporter S component [Caldilineaceae bacterium]|nr:ECF transporter S component [Caldilineaceae bacterium]